MEFTFDQLLEQKQVLSQQQIYSLHILSLNGYELQQFLAEAQLENPFLEVKIKGGEVSIREEEPWTMKGTRDREEEYSLIENLGASSESLRDFLFSQVEYKALTKAQLPLFAYMTELLDNNGYLRYGREEISRLTGAGAEEVETCLRVLQSLEPAGIGAGDLKECLVLQLKRLKRYDKVYEKLLGESLSDLAAGKYHKLAEGLGISTEEIYARVKQIKGLNPKPLNGTGFGEGKSQYLLPDVIFAREGEDWTVRLSGSNQIAVGISREYEALSGEQSDPIIGEYCREHRKRAAFLGRCVEKRRETILKISRYILAYQMEFFEGRGPLKALTARQVAQELSLHPSTVGRAIKDKYVQYPAGILLLKHLLAAPFGGQEGGSANRQTVIAAMRELIGAEDRRRPYSDQALTEKLRERGFSISRRTVALYRSQLEIGNVQSRRLAYQEEEEH